MTVEVRTDDPAAHFTVGAVLTTDPLARGPLTLAGYRRANGVTLLRFDGIDDRNAAETLRNTLLVVPTAALPELSGEDEFYDHQLIGIRAEHRDGTVIGEILDVMHLPAGEVLVVRTDRTASGEVLIPFVRAIVPVVDLAHGRVVVDPPDGLFE